MGVGKSERWGECRRVGQGQVDTSGLTLYLTLCPSRMRISTIVPSQSGVRHA